MKCMNKFIFIFNKSSVSKTILNDQMSSAFRFSNNRYFMLFCLVLETLCINSICFDRRKCVFGVTYFEIFLHQILVKNAIKLYLHSLWTKNTY